MDKVIQELKELEVGKVLENEPLSNHTTIKIGGPADVLVVPKNIQAVKDTMKVIKKHGVKWTAIGRGSNLLVLDEGIRGVVIKLGQGLDHMEIDGEQVTVGGGYSVVRLATGISK
ncbi:UDP-N-acetylenolpyruvoylglucosamine reductase, partial [Bacillus amyloliquefaciens]